VRTLVATVAVRQQQPPPKRSWELAKFSVSVCPTPIRYRARDSESLAVIYHQPGRTSARFAHGQWQRLGVRTDGAIRTVFEQAASVQSGPGRPDSYEGITQDITERVQAAERIRQLAHHDEFTGLPNRQFFAELAARRSSARHAMAPAAPLCMRTSAASRNSR